MNGNLVLRNDGYHFISENGIEYEILEGMSIGAKIRRYSSCLIFVVLFDQTETFDAVQIIDFFCDQEDFGKEGGDNEKYIREIVDKFEKENMGKIIKMKNLITNEM